MATKRPRQQYTSPAGIAGWSYLNIPDTGPRDKPRPPKYRTDLACELAAPGVAEFLESIRGVTKLAYEWACDEYPSKAGKMNIFPLPIFTPQDEEKKDIPGMVAFKFRLRGLRNVSDGVGGLNQIKQRPVLIDAALAPMSPAGDMIGRGSKLVIAGQMWCWQMDRQVSKEQPDGSLVNTTVPVVGVTLGLEMVQVLELVRPTGGRDQSPAGFGLTAQEGYQAPGEAAQDVGGEFADLETTLPLESTGGLGGLPGTVADPDATAESPHLAAESFDPSKFLGG